MNSRNSENIEKQQSTTPTSLTGTNNNNINNNNSCIDDASAIASWDNLPSVILLEIFSYLNHDSRIQASQVCKHWRYALFHPNFWNKITFNFTNKESIQWFRYLSSWFKLSVREVTIKCEPEYYFVKEVLLVLKRLSNNRQLSKLILEPTRGMFEDPCLEVNSQVMMEQLLKIIKTSNKLEFLSLGCIEELTENMGDLLDLLCKHHSNHLTHLSLASVKEDPDRYDVYEIDSSLFNHFNKLTVLTIDYYHLCDDLLLALNSGVMERLVIHVHNWDGEYGVMSGASNDAWMQFTEKNPKCELRLNLIHSYSAVDFLDLQILKPAMPLSHLKVLFCESLNIEALHKVSQWYSNTLQSLVWIDSFNSQKNVHDPGQFTGIIDNPDPLVLAAWRCKKLNEIVFMGRKYFSEHIIAIVRLRSKALKRLEFAQNDIHFDEHCYNQSELFEEVKRIMGTDWKLLSNEELPKVIVNNLLGDSREVVMPMVLQDQK